MSGIIDRPGEVAGEEAFARLLGPAQRYLVARRRGEEPDAAARAAWDEFFRAGNRLIHRTLRRADLAAADRADCAQEVWGELIAALPRFVPGPGRGAVGAWLRAVTRYTARDHARRVARRNAAILDGVAEPPAGPEDDPAAVAARADDFAWVVAVFAAYRAQAPPTESEVVRRCVLNDQSLPAAATALGLTADQVRYRKHLAIQSLRALAGPRGG